MVFNAKRDETASATGASNNRISVKTPTLCIKPDLCLCSFKKRRLVCVQIRVRLHQEDEAGRYSRARCADECCMIARFKEQSCACAHGYTRNPLTLQRLSEIWKLVTRRLDERRWTTLEARAVEGDTIARFGLRGKSRMALYRSKKSSTRCWRQQIQPRGTGQHALWKERTMLRRT